MSPRRRSSRLKAGSTSTKSHQHLKSDTCLLGSLIESEETSRVGAQSNLNAILSSPRHNPMMPSPLNIRSPATIRTPGGSHTPLRPSYEEMHPSKAQQSTTKQPDSALRLGFSDVDPTMPMDARYLQQTPTKIRGDLPRPTSSPGFEFKFTRPGPQLGAEAQKMMASLREEALQIKKDLAAEKAAADAKAEHSVALLGEGGAQGRKIAQAKGRAGRFSDIHMAEFRKMDSIAGHPSAYRARHPLYAVSEEAPKRSLKRSKSQAKLDEPDTLNSLASSSTVAPKATIPASPRTIVGHEESSKRIKQHPTDDASVARASAQDPSHPFNRRLLPSVVTTPTKASLARAASTRKLFEALPLTPTLSRTSASQSRFGFKAGTKSESSTKYLSLTNFTKMKSILRRPQIFSATDFEASDVSYPTVAGLSSASHSNTTDQGGLDLNRDLPSLPTTPPSRPFTSKLARAQSIKHVNFSPTKTVKRIESDSIISPSPARMGPRPQSVRSRLAAPTISYPTLPRPGSSSSAACASSSPIRPTSSAGEIDNVSGFTFRSPRIAAGHTPFGIGQLSTAKAATIRAVRPSAIGSSAMPSMSSVNRSVMETTNEMSIPALPHGLRDKSKKRSREDDNESMWDVSEHQTIIDEPSLRSAKKHRGMASWMHKSSPARPARWMSSPTKPKGMSVVDLEKEKENHRQGMDTRNGESHSGSGPSVSEAAREGRKLAKPKTRLPLQAFKNTPKASPDNPRKTPTKRILSMTRLNALARPKDRPGK